MGKSSPSAPPPPDYAGAAQAQGAANVETARVQGRMNNPNIVGPLGGQTVTFGENDQPTVTQNLTPTAQSTLESQQRVQQALANLGEQGLGTAREVLATKFNPNLPDIQTRVDTSGIAKMPVNAGTTGQEAIMSRLAPQLEKSDAATRQRLINQGLVPGGEAYENAMISQNQQKNDLLTQAALQGINLDTAANAQGYNQELQSGQFTNTAIQQLLAKASGLRAQPLNEISGLMSGSQIQMPQFQGYQGSNIAPAPIFAGAQAAGQGAMDRYGIASSNVNAQNAGLYELLGAGGAAGIMKYSDPRLKSNVVRVGTHRLGIGVYEYDIFGNRERGVMADEVEAVMPEAVALHPSGYKMVNYGMIN